MFKLTSTFLVLKKHAWDCNCIVQSGCLFLTSNDDLEDIKHVSGINKRYVEFHNYPWPNSLNHIFENKC
jgi:hypothetical protein